MVEASLAAYAYVANNPLNATDPSGKCLEDLCIIEGTVVVVLVVGACAMLLSSLRWNKGGTPKSMPPVSVPGPNLDPGYDPSHLGSPMSPGGGPIAKRLAVILAGILVFVFGPAPLPPAPRSKPSPTPTPTPKPKPIRLYI